MRRADQLIRQIRRQADNEDVSATVGFSDDELLSYINDAQDRLQSVLSARYGSLFDVDYITSIVGQQEEYRLPEDCYTKNRIRAISYSLSGRWDEYGSMGSGSLYNRNYTSEMSYIPRSGGFLLDEPPLTNTGSIRVTYERSLDNIDKRRGQIDSTLFDGSGSSTTTTTVYVGSILSILMGGVGGSAMVTTVTTTIPATTGNLMQIVLRVNQWLDADKIIDSDYICVNDANGNVLAYNIPVVFYDPAIYTIYTTYPIAPVVPHVGSINGGSAPNSSIPVGAYITCGRYTTTHLAGVEQPTWAPRKLTEECERYIIAYAVWKVMKRDSSSDANAQNEELAAIESDLVSTYSDVGRDIKRIPIIEDYWFY